MASATLALEGTSARRTSLSAPLVPKTPNLTQSAIADSAGRGPSERCQQGSQSRGPKDDVVFRDGFDGARREG